MFSFFPKLCHTILCILVYCSFHATSIFSTKIQTIKGSLYILIPQLSIKHNNKNIKIILQLQHWIFILQWGDLSFNFHSKSFSENKIFISDVKVNILVCLSRQIIEETPVLERQSIFTLSLQLAYNATIWKIKTSKCSLPNAFSMCAYNMLLRF